MITRHVGSSTPRIIDAPLVTGHGTYADDIKLPGMLHAAILRSPHAHARIEKVDMSDALKIPGTIAAFSGKDVKNYPIAECIDLAPFKQFGAKDAKIYPLALDKVRYVGDPVAVVLAESKHTAAEALSQIDVNYKPIPAVVDTEKALAHDSPKVYDNWDSNLFLKRRLTKGNVDEAFKYADYTIKDTVTVQRYTSTPIEPRSYLASYEKITGRLTFYASTQQPHPLRTLISYTLKIPETQIRVVQPTVGGGFGLKTPVFQDELLVPFLSLKTGRPVKYTEERREQFLAGGHARDQKHYFEIAFNKEGEVLGLKDRIVADVGVVYPMPGWGMPIVTSIHIPTIYKIPNVDVELKIVATNKNAFNSYRGYGKECAVFLMERIMDMVAKKLGKDRADIRLKNFIQPNEFPFELSSAATIDSGNYPGALKKALQLFGYQEMLKEQEKARSEGRLFGIGIASELTPGGGCIPGSFFLQYDGVTVKVAPSGKVTVLTGITSPGTGQETCIAQIVADELGAALDDITVIQGDTDTCPYGLGNMSDRSMITGGPAAASAAREIKSKLAKVAASMLEAPVDEIDVNEGKLYVHGSPQKAVTIEQVANAIYKYPYDLASDVEPGLEVTKYFKMPNARHIPDERGYTTIYTAYPNGANLCAVEVDKETAQLKILKYAMIHDCGVLINPMFVEGQLHGGLTQGLGGTIFEELIYDESGQLLTTTFMDYPIPTSRDVPNFILGHQETRSPYNPLGAKGVGESGVTGAPACIVSAVEDALSPYEVKINETPLKPNKLWRMIKDAKNRDNNT